MTLITDNDESFVKAVERENPDIVNLARVVSLAVRIEPELLRKARLELLPQIDAGAEAELWFSPLTQSRTPLSVILLPEAAKVLRRRLAENQEELRRAWEILKEIHKNASPTLILEEEVTWLALTNREDAVTQIQGRLEEVLVSLANEDRPGLARWAARALPLLPEAARTSQAARVLSVIAGVKTGKPQILKDNPSASALQKWLRLVSPKSPDDVPVGVRLLERADGGAAPQRVIEFSNPPAPESHKITAPKTNPFLFEVSWEDQSGQHFEQMSLAPSQTQTFNVGTAPIKIRTALGKTHTLVSGELASEQTGQAQIPLSIPTSPLPLVGRADLVEKIKGELSKKQLIALTGIVGSGKTALAVEVARQSVDIYRQRIVWINASAHVEFSLWTMLDEVCTQLGRADLRRLGHKEKYRATNELILQAPLLLILDNFERLPRKTQEACQSFLASPSPCSVLITTNRPIGAANRIEVGNLSEKDTQVFLETYMTRSVGAVFKREDILEPRQYIGRASGNPLLIIWILAQLRGSSVGANRARFAINKSRASDLIKEIIYSLLPVEQAVLTALALFVPDASHDALAKVTSLGKAGFHSAVSQLESMCLIRSTAGAERLMIEGFTREIIRREILRLDSISKPRPLTLDIENLFEPFVEYFRLYAERHVGPTPQNFDALEIEKENLLSAVELAFKASDYARVFGIVQILNSNLGEGFLFQRGYWDEAMWINELALHGADRIKNEELQVLCTQHKAYIHQKRGELLLARKLYSRAMVKAKRGFYMPGYAVSLYQLGQVADAQGKLKEAEKFYRQSMHVYTNLNTKRGAALAMHELARLAQRQGRRQEAEWRYQESLILLKDVRPPDRAAMARVRFDFGRLFYEMGDLANARSSYINSAKIQRELKDQSGMAETYYELGRVAFAQGNIKEAGKLFDGSMEICRELEDQRGVAKIFLEMGRLAQARAEWDAADSYYRQSLDISRALDNKPAIASALLPLAEWARTRQQLDEAQRLCDESLQISLALDNERGTAEALYLSGLIAKSQGNRGKAVKLLHRALIMFKRLDMPVEYVQAAMVAIEQGLKPARPSKTKMSGSAKRNVPEKRLMRAASKKPARKRSAARKSAASSAQVAHSVLLGATVSAVSDAISSIVYKVPGPQRSGPAKGRSKKRAMKSGKAKKRFNKRT